MLAFRLLGFRLYVVRELVRFHWYDLKRLAFMNCPLCGEVCHCPSEPLPSASSQRTPDLDPGPSSPGALDAPRKDEEFAGDNAAEARNSSESSPNSTESSPSLHPDSPAEDAPAWRDELSARLNRYRARRKVRPPRYPSLSLPLSLQFEAREFPTSPTAPAAPSPLPVFEQVSNHALALDGMSMTSPDCAAEEPEEPFRQPRSVASPQPKPAGNSSGHANAGHTSAGHYGSTGSPGATGAKIIEFPGFAWGPPAPPPDQLAEPVSGRPRILEVPEIAPPPPALGGITIEAAAHPEAEKRPGIDIPLQSAPLGRRMVAALIDGLIITAASAAFGCIFWKVAGVRPPLAQLVGLAVGIPAAFWAAYQYLMIVYAASTPGLRVAGLELARFDGSSTSRSLRRWRVLASWLSAVSAGMGYAWVFLDEDALCWHDRITHTYLAPAKRQTKTEGC
jgi:uncharacterized RDD family membrane protein YckC